MCDIKALINVITKIRLIILIFMIIISIVLYQKLFSWDARRGGCCLRVLP